MAFPLFTTTLTPAQLTLPSDIQLTLALGATTMVLLTSTQNLAIVSLAADGGNTDGMVVALQNLSGFTLSYAHQSGLATATNRFANASLAAASGGVAGTVWYRYHGTIQRWLHIAST